MINRTLRMKVYLLIFVFTFAIALALFTIRTGNKTLTTDANAMSTQLSPYSSVYTMGKIMDRKGRMIVKGYAVKENEYLDTKTELAFTNLLGDSTYESMPNRRRTIAGLSQEIYGKFDNRLSLKSLLPTKRIGGNVKTTFDEDLQTKIYEILKNKGYEKSAVIVSNYKTGEILAAVSLPSYELSEVETLQKEENGCYTDEKTINKVFMSALNPGSTMKPVIMAACLSIDPSLKNYTYDCTAGNHNFKNYSSVYHVDCANSELHGKGVTMNQAMAESCNGYFISLVNQVDKYKLLDKLCEWGFDSQISYGSTMLEFADSTFLGTASANGSEYLLGVIGQANAKETPFAVNTFMAAIMNQGTIAAPKVVISSSTDPDGEMAEKESGEDKKICSKKVANQVKKALAGVTSYGTGKNFYMKNFIAKTGTAEKETKNGEKKYTVWTTGGLDDEKHPYCITVMIDDVNSKVKSSDAGKTAKEILEYYIKNE